MATTWNWLRIRDITHQHIHAHVRQAIPVNCRRAWGSLRVHPRQRDRPAISLKIVRIQVPVRPQPIGQHQQRMDIVRPRHDYLRPGRGGSGNQRRRGGQQGLGRQRLSRCGWNRAGGIRQSRLPGQGWLRISVCPQPAKKIRLVIVRRIKRVNFGQHISILLWGHESAGVLCSDGAHCSPPESVYQNCIKF